MEKTYALIETRIPGGGTRYYCGQGNNGERFLVLYSGREQAESHRMLENLDPEDTEVVEWSADKVRFFIDVWAAALAPDSFEGVAVDPPLTTSDGPPQPVLVTPVEEFLAPLRKEANGE